MHDYSKQDEPILLCHMGVQIIEMINEHNLIQLRVINSYVSQSPYQHIRLVCRTNLIEQLPGRCLRVCTGSSISFLFYCLYPMRPKN